MATDSVTISSRGELIATIIRIALVALAASWLTDDVVLIAISAAVAAIIPEIPVLLERVLSRASERWRDDPDSENGGDAK